MKMYRCLSDEYEEYINGEIYEEDYRATNSRSVASFVNIFPDDWELVEDDEPISLVDMVRDVLEKVGKTIGEYYDGYRCDELVLYMEYDSEIWIRLNENVGWGTVNTKDICKLSEWESFVNNYKNKLDNNG